MRKQSNLVGLGEATNLLINQQLKKLESQIILNELKHKVTRIIANIISVRPALYKVLSVFIELNNVLWLHCLGSFLLILALSSLIRMGILS